MFLDSDDYLLPSAAERIVSVWRAGVQIVHHRLKIVDSAGKEAGHWPNELEKLDSGNVVPSLLKTGLYGAPPSSGLAYGRDLLNKLLPMPEADFRICADAWIFLQAPFFSPIIALDEDLACYRLHENNNWGPGWPTRLTTRKRLETFMTIRNRGQSLVEKQARKSGLVVNPLDWENPITLRWKLILMRLGSLPSTKQTRTLMVRTIFDKIKMSPYSFLRKLKERLITLTVWSAPRFVLRPIFPNMF